MRWLDGITDTGDMGLGGFATPWTEAYQAPQSTEIFQARVLEWIAFSSPGDLPDPGDEPRSPALQADALPSEPPRKSKQYC